jgi:hypothetical protein
MKPNGKYFAVRAVFLTLCAASLLSTLGSAETVRGNFKLTTETHWGKLLLAPGAYDFTITTDVSRTIVTVHSRDSGWSGMAMAEGSSDAKPDEGMKLLLVKSEAGTYVRALCLGDSGITLTYAMPKSGKVTRLTQERTANTTIASASSGQQ